jgi:hypothetical protein
MRTRVISRVIESLVSNNIVHYLKSAMARRVSTIPLRRPSELERVEALCDALVERMGSGTRKTAARIIRAYDRDRRDRQRARIDQGFTPRTRVGRARGAEIIGLLEQAGWTIRETVDRKLPLMNMPPELQTLVRQRRLDPSKALLLNRVKQRDFRNSLTNEVLRGLTLRALYNAIYTQSSIEPTALDVDLRMLERETTQLLGTRVSITPSGILIDCYGIENINAVLEKMGVEF